LGPTFLAAVPALKKHAKFEIKRLCLMKSISAEKGSSILEFENLEEFENLCAHQISLGEISFPMNQQLPEPGFINLTLRVSRGKEFSFMAKVFRRSDGAIAAVFQKKPEDILAAIRPKNPPPAMEPDDFAANKSDWDRVRGLTRTEKLILAPKGTRLERAILAQDNDALILYTLLKNPRVTTEEVVKIARSSALSVNIVDLILSTTQWSANNEIRIALVQNPRTPTPTSLKLLSTIPEPIIRQIAKGTAVNQTLKQAAVRLVTGIDKG
jgi:hypothetical protein